MGSSAESTRTEASKAPMGGDWGGGIPSPLGWVYREGDMPVCLSVCQHISKTRRPNFTRFSTHVAYNRSPVPSLPLAALPGGYAPPRKKCILSFKIVHFDAF